MRKDAVLAILIKAKPKLMQQFGIVRLALFGSTARDEASEQSDVDILVAFDGMATSEVILAYYFFWKTI